MTEFTFRSGFWYSPDKDPDSILDYTINWLTWLNGDTIKTSTWTIPAGLTIDPVGGETNTTTTTTVWLSGGTAGTTYTILNRIITNGRVGIDPTGRKQDRIFKIYVKEL